MKEPLLLVPRASWEDVMAGGWAAQRAIGQRAPAHRSDEQGGQRGADGPRTGAHLGRRSCPVRPSTKFMQPETTLHLVSSCVRQILNSVWDALFLL